MSERRRRTVRVSGDSEELSEGSEDVEIIKASEGESEHDAEPSGPRGESEYESADSDDERGSVEKPVQHNSGQEASSDINEDDEELIDEEDDELLYGDKREEGDGQESITSKEKKLDDDEDRRNPQYIPKRGTFYEHDDRTTEDQDEEETKKEEPKKKKVWKENDDSWSHDKFNESDQAPKSRDELVASYGYDIRNEEGPPRARRRRRYGRGPNKYDRNWEDENAYSKPTRGGGGRGGLRRSNDGLDRGSKPSSVGEEELDLDEEEFPALSAAPPRRGAPRSRGGRGPREFESSQRQQARSQKAVESMPPRALTPPSVSHTMANTPPAPTNEPTRSGRGKPRIGGSGRFVESRGKNRGTAQVPSDRHEKRNIPGPREDVKREPRRENVNLELEMKNLSMKDDAQTNRNYRGQAPNKSPNSSSSYHQSGERRQANVPPRLQQDAAANRPKRYSSQRQRSLPESSSNYDQSPAFYEQQGYQQHTVFADTAQPPQAQPAAVPVTSAQPPAPSPQILPPPAGPAFAPNFPSPPPTAYIPHVQPAPQPPRLYTPTQPAPTFMAPSGSMINYVPTPPAQFAPTYPAFQSFPPVPQPPPPQPTEMFVPSSGITYYSPQNQVPRHTPLKRPKAAIPILPPPPKDKDRNSATRQDSQSTSGQEDNIQLDCNDPVLKEQTPTKEVSIEPPEQMDKNTVDHITPDKEIEAAEPTVKIEETSTKIVESVESKSNDLDSAPERSDGEVLTKEVSNITEPSIQTAPSNTEEIKSDESSEPLPA
ncbi:hypothetical protein B566_EDAN008736 [Ephemera danica]|nr:hypothetical protein B566_EDAN008736 [Ephemera danica]